MIPYTLIYEGVPETFNVCYYHLDHWVNKGYGDRQAVIDIGLRKTYTYNELLELTCKISNILKKEDLDLGDRVAIVARDNVTGIAAFLAAVRIGMVPFFINPNYDAEEISYYLADSRARIIFTDKSCISKIQTIKTGIGIKLVKKTYIFDSPEFRARLYNTASWAPLEEVHKDDPAYWVYTSGTTDKPKAAVHLHHDLPYSVYPYIINVTPIEVDSLFYSASKLYFSAGRMFGLHIPLMTGSCTLIDPERSDPDRVLDNLTSFDVTHFLAVPTLYLKLIMRIKMRGAENVRFKKLKYCIAGGEQLPATVFERWREITGIEIYNGIGSSEAEWIYISYLPERAKPGAAGQPIPMWNVKLVDDKGEDITTSGVVGTLYLRGESVSPFYWHRRDDTKRYIVGEWFNTKDKLYFDHDGYFYYVGRIDDVFKIHGMWISPLEIEEVILKTGLVSECAVTHIATPPEDLNIMVAFVVPKNQQQHQLLNELKDKISGFLPPFKIPKHFLIIDEIPRTATGKIKRAILKEMAKSRLIQNANTQI